MALKFKSGVCATAALLWLASASAQEPGHGPGGDRGGGDPQRGGGPGGEQRGGGGPGGEHGGQQHGGQGGQPQRGGGDGRGGGQGRGDPGGGGPHPQGQPGGPHGGPGQRAGEPHPGPGGYQRVDEPRGWNARPTSIISKPPAAITSVPIVARPAGSTGAGAMATCCPSLTGRPATSSPITGCSRWKYRPQGSNGCGTGRTRY